MSSTSTLYEIEYELLYLLDSLDQIAQIAALVEVRMWSVFFLVVTGRALSGDDLMAEEYEQVFEKLYEISRWASFDVKTTEAMHYRRYLAQRNKEEATAASGAQKTVWRGIAKGNINFGFNLGFAQGVEIEDEVWDDDPPRKNPGRKAGPGQGVPKAEEKR